MGQINKDDMFIQKGQKEKQDQKENMKKRNDKQQN
jgi:hypothetical protein